MAAWAPADQESSDEPGEDDALVVGKNWCRAVVFAFRVQAVVDEVIGVDEA